MAKIMIVEDNALIAELIQMVLKARGYEFLHTADGGKAVDLIREFQPDMVLLDVMLPGLDGYGIQSKLLEEEETRNIPVVIMTSKGQVEEIFKSASNVAALLPKPFSVNELVQRVQEVLGRKP